MKERILEQSKTVDAKHTSVLLLHLGVNLTNEFMPTHRPTQGRRTHGPVTLEQSGSGISRGDGRNTIENRGDVTNQAWQQTVYGGIHINQSV
jgi:hypothetical protein